MKPILFALLVFNLIGCSGPVEPSQEVAVLEVAEPDSLTQAVDMRLDSLLKTDIFPGFSVSVVNETEIIYQKGLGFADKEAGKPYTTSTLSNIASISKMAIGLALLKANEQGVLSLDDPINKHLLFEVVNAHFPDSAITIRQLATHTSSILDGQEYMNHDYVRFGDIPLDSTMVQYYASYYQNPAEDWISLSDFLFESLNNGGKWYSDSTFADWAPGARFEYSNLGAALCGLVIESASGMDFAAYTQEHIFKPLGMHSTAWSPKSVDMSNHTKLYRDGVVLPYYEILSYPDGGLITTNQDLSVLLQELIKGYAGSGTILKKESFQTYFKPQLSDEQLHGKADFNAGFFTEMHLPYHVIGHSGGDPGVNTLMYFDSETLVGKIMILNSDSGKEESDGVYWGIWNALDVFQ